MSKITLTMDNGHGYALVAKPEDPYATLATQGPHCPTCYRRSVLVAHDIRRTAIFRAGDQHKAEAYLRERGAKGQLEVVPDCGSTGATWSSGSTAPRVKPPAGGAIAPSEGSW